MGRGRLGKVDVESREDFRFRDVRTLEGATKVTGSQDDGGLVRLVRRTGVYSQNDHWTLGRTVRNSAVDFLFRCVGQDQVREVLSIYDR